MLTLFLSPALRGAKDSLREPIEQLLRSTATLRVASQQVSDRAIVNALAGVYTERGGRGYVLIEADYLHERRPVRPESVWIEGGEREEHRQCFLALTRGGVKVRGDVVGSALQHVNMVVASGQNRSNCALVTSANFSPGSLNQHFNWGIAIADDEACAALEAVFDQAWDGDFRDIRLDQSRAIDGAECWHVCGGAQGQAIDLAVKTVETAQESIRFAYFNMATDSRVVAALGAASARGATVAGVVDGDQQGASWDAVRSLRASGVDVRYYPGALTGAIGRMHYKMMAVDSNIVHLSTANASQAAESSFELGITLRGSEPVGNPVPYINDEITRLLRGASSPVENR